MGKKIKIIDFRTFKTKAQARSWGKKQTTKKDYSGYKVYSYRVEPLFTSKGKKRYPLGKDGDKYVTFIV